MRLLSLLSAFALLSVSAFAHEGDASDALEKRLDAMEAKLLKLQESNAPLLSDSKGDALPSNIVVKRVESDANAELVVKALRPCRILIVSRYLQRSSVNYCELRVNGVTRDVHAEWMVSKLRAPQRTMSTVVDAGSGEVLRIEARKIETPIKFGRIDLNGIGARFQNLANNTITLVAMPLDHKDGVKQGGADRPATGAGAQTRGGEKVAPELTAQSR